MEVNYLLRPESNQLTSNFPDYLKRYLDVFLAVNTKKLAPYWDIDLVIKLRLGIEPLYRLIYSLSPWELAVLKEFLEENLAKGFIRESKSLVGTPILFVPKKDGSLRLYVDYSQESLPLTTDYWDYGLSYRG